MRKGAVHGGGARGALGEHEEQQIEQLHAGPRVLGQVAQHLVQRGLLRVHLREEEQAHQGGDPRAVQQLDRVARGAAPRRLARRLLAEVQPHGRGVVPGERRAAAGRLALAPRRLALRLGTWRARRLAVPRLALCELGAHLGRKHVEEVVGDAERRRGLLEPVAEVLREERLLAQLVGQRLQEGRVDPGVGQVHRLPVHRDGDPGRGAVRGGRLGLLRRRLAHLHVLARALARLAAPDALHLGLELVQLALALVELLHGLVAQPAGLAELLLLRLALRVDAGLGLRLGALARVVAGEQPVDHVVAHQLAAVRGESAAEQARLLRPARGGRQRDEPLRLGDHVELLGALRRLARRVALPVLGLAGGDVHARRAAAVVRQLDADAGVAAALQAAVQHHLEELHRAAAHERLDGAHHVREAAGRPVAPAVRRAGAAARLLGAVLQQRVDGRVHLVPARRAVKRRGNVVVRLVHAEARHAALGAGAAQAGGQEEGRGQRRAAVVLQAVRAHDARAWHVRPAPVGAEAVVGAAERRHRVGHLELAEAAVPDGLVVHRRLAAVVRVLVLLLQHNVVDLVAAHAVERLEDAAHGRVLRLGRAALDDVVELVLAVVAAALLFVVVVEVLELRRQLLVLHVLERILVVHRARLAVAVGLLHLGVLLAVVRVGGVALLVLVHHLDDVRLVTVEPFLLGAELAAVVAVVVLVHLDVVLLFLHLVAQLVLVVGALVHLAGVHAEARVAVEVGRLLLLVLAATAAVGRLAHRLLAAAPALGAGLRVLRLRVRRVREGPVAPLPLLRLAHLDGHLGEVLERAQHALDQRLDRRQVQVHVRERPGERRDKVLLEHRLGHVQRHLFRGPRAGRAVRPRGEQPEAQVRQRVETAVAALELLLGARRVLDRLVHRVEQRLAHRHERRGHLAHLGREHHVCRERHQHGHGPVGLGHALPQLLVLVVAQEARRHQLVHKVGEHRGAVLALGGLPAEVHEALLARGVGGEQLREALHQEEHVERLGVLLRDRLLPARGVLRLGVPGVVRLLLAGHAALRRRGAVRGRLRGLCTPTRALPELVEEEVHDQVRLLAGAVLGGAEHGRRVLGLLAALEPQVRLALALLELEDVHLGARRAHKHLGLPQHSVGHALGEAGALGVARPHVLHHPRLDLALHRALQRGGVLHHVPQHQERARLAAHHVPDVPRAEGAEQRRHAASLDERLRLRLVPGEQHQHPVHGERGVVGERLGALERPERELEHGVVPRGERGEPLSDVHGRLARLAAQLRLLRQLAQ